MHNNPELQVSSAKQLMELNQQREKEARRKKEAEQQAKQLESEKIELLKESDELAKQASTEANQMSHGHSTDLCDFKPNIFGIGPNLNEMWRRIKQWRLK